MGFFSGLLGGGGGSQTSTTGDPTFLKAQKNLTAAMLPYIPRDRNADPNQKQRVIDMWTPLAQTADESQAFDMMRQGFTPNQETLNADIDMMMNPFDNYVIDEINRQAMGDKSILDQVMTAAGQLGSNRQMFGAGDIERNRLREIGLFKQDQYNTALDAALNRLPSLRQQDALNLAGIGEFQRALDRETKIAPINAINALAGNIISLPGYSQTTTKSGGGISLGDIGSLVNTGASIFSDPRLKQNIAHIGIENGHNIYEFNYNGDDKRYIGVMADEVAEMNPDAVTEIDGFLAVDYDAIGVKFREVE